MLILIAGFQLMLIIINQLLNSQLPITASYMFVFSDVRSKTAAVGETVHLQCGAFVSLGTYVDWHHKRPSDTRPRQIIAGGRLANGDFDGRLNISGSTLFISDVQINDAGIYTCVKRSGQGMLHHISLFVHGNSAAEIFHHLFK